MSSGRAAMLVWTVAWVVSGCTCAGAEGSRAADRLDLSSTPAAPDAPVDGCGEPTETPTELPTALASGPTVVGVITAGVDETVTLEGIVVRYEARGFVGSRDSGRWGPALRVAIPRAEVGEHEPWGTPITSVSPGFADAFEIGPYLFEVAASDAVEDGDTPASVSVAVRRASCPRHLIRDEALDGPLSLWLSTDAMRSIAIDPMRDRLSFSVHSLPTTSQARIDVDSDAYHQHVTLSPGREVTIEPPGRRVTIDRVVLPDGCDADGETVRCTVDGRSVAPRMHVRVRVEPRAAVRPEVATHPAAGCGEPTPGSLGAPPVLAPPERRFVVPFGDGQSHRVADVEVSVRSLPDGPDLLWLSVAGEPTEQRSIPFAPNLAGQTLRLGRNLFVARPGDRPAFVVYRTACTRTITASLGAGPHAFWLGSDGVEQIVFEPRAAERSAPHAFSATWSMDRGRAQVSVSRADSYATVFVRPDAVGRSFTLDGARFVVVAIAPRQGTTWADDRWEGGDPIPRLLVGFQVTLSDE